MAVFKQAMEINVPAANKNQYNKSHYQLLDDHYDQKVVQVHVMYEYAQLGMAHINQAAGLVTDYFSQVNEEFIGRYFKNRKAQVKSKRQK